MSGNGKGAWAVIGSIAVALITSVTSIVIAVVASGNVDDYDEQAEAAVETTAVDRVWVNDRFAQYEKELAVEKALRMASEKSCQDRVGRLESRVFRRRGGGPRTGDPVAVVAPPAPSMVEAELEKIKAKRPPKPKRSDPRIQQILKGERDKKAAAE